jgi:hypothetical protein
MGVLINDTQKRIAHLTLFVGAELEAVFAFEFDSGGRLLAVEVHVHASAGRITVKVDQFEQGALARATFPHDAQHFPGV